MLRAVVLTVACLWCAGSLVAVALDPGAWPMLPVAMLVLAGTVFERVRYRGDRVIGGDVAAPTWHATGERFLDEATGTPIDVWFDPASGARRYVAAGEAPPAR